MAPTFNNNLPALLPSRAQGTILLDYYFDHVNWIYHIIHKPTVRRLFDSLYTSIELGRIPDYGHLSLITTLFALSAYFCGPKSGLYFKSTEAMTHSRRWTLLGPVERDHQFSISELQALAPVPAQQGWSQIVRFGDDRIDLDRYFDECWAVAIETCEVFVA